MKDIVLFIKENLQSKSINEALKDVTVPRKGSYVYILKDGDTKVQKVKIENVIKRPMGKGYRGSFTYIAELAENAYEIPDYAFMRFASINYSPKSVEAVNMADTTYYFGVDAQSINDFVKADAGKKLESVLKDIEKLEKELAEANEKKAKLEEKINGDITESLNEGKEKFVKFSLLGDDESKSAMDKISTAADKAKLYYEKIDDNSFKIKVKSGSDVSGIENILNELIDAIPEDKKEELQSKADSIKSSIDKMKEAAAVEEENPDKKEEE